MLEKFDMYFGQGFKQLKSGVVLYIIAILQITGIIGMSFRISWFVEAIKNYELAIPFVGSSILMVTLNFILFVPLGFLIPIVFKRNN